MTETHRTVECPVSLVISMHGMPDFPPIPVSGTGVAEIVHERPDFEPLNKEFYYPVETVRGRMSIELSDSDAHALCVQLLSRLLRKAQ